MCEEKHQRTWEARWFLRGPVRLSRPNESEPKVIRESDQLIVLGERESRLPVRGLSGNWQSYRDHGIGLR
jgi:hypothetical protein